MGGVWSYQMVLQIQGFFLPLRMHFGGSGNNSKTVQSNREAYAKAYSWLKLP